jgi:hypothetical protein
LYYLIPTAENSDTSANDEFDAITLGVADGNKYLHHLENGWFCEMVEA